MYKWIGKKLCEGQSSNSKLISLSKYVRYLVLYLSDDQFLHTLGVVRSPVRRLSSAGSWTYSRNDTVLT